MKCSSKDEVTEVQIMKCEWWLKQSFMLLIVQTGGCACNATHYVSVTLYSNFIFVSIITDLRPVVSAQDGAHLDFGEIETKIGCVVKQSADHD